MPSIIGKDFAIYDLNEFPTFVYYKKDGKPFRNRKLAISPYTTGEPVMLLYTDKFPTEEKEPIPSKEQLLKIGHTHEFSEEIMIRKNAGIGVAMDGIMFDLPAGSAFAAKPGGYHSNADIDSTLGNSTLCVFVPPIPEDEDANYLELIKMTNEYLAKAKRV